MAPSSPASAESLTAVGAITFASMSRFEGRA